MSANLEELESLLLDWEEGTLDEEGAERLREILRIDEQARAHFVQFQMIHAALKQEGEAGLRPAIGGPESLGFTARKTNGRSRFRFRASHWLGAAAILLIALLVGRLAQLELSDQTPAATDTPAPEIIEKRARPEEPTSRGVALVTRLVDVVWDKDQKPVEEGDALVPSRLSIKSGFVQIEFFCGATVILEGPAELQLESASLARVLKGRLRAQVPPAARGFSLETGEVKVVDLGTEFGLSVSGKGVNVQVINGEVELHHPSEQVKRLTAGQGLVRTANGTYEKTNVTPDRFVDIPGLEKRVQGRQNARYQQWKRWSQNLRKDPRLIAYYAMDDNSSWERKLQCSMEPRRGDLDGAIVGARRVSGRWESKGGLEFRRPADRVMVHLPGEYRSLTFACWVRIDSLDRWYNSLFLTDGYDKGEPHWQILDTGQLFFSIRVSSERGKGPEHREVLSPPFWGPSMSGRWLHLATTFDVDRKLVTHYLDGEMLSQEKIPDPQLATSTRIGRATIGNWTAPTKPDARFAIRNLNGSLDELTLFSAALTSTEIKEMYQKGKP